MTSWEDDEFLQKTKSLNINAKEFVPSFLTKSETPPTETISDNGVGDKPKVEEVAPIVAPKPAPELKESTPSEIKVISPTKEFINIVFIGHVDAGKSTIGGNLLYLTGMVDERDVEKNKRKAAEMNRESWYLSWSLDVNEDERAKGKTVECGRAYFETEKKHFNLIDAPGHKSYVTHMINGSSQADIAILVISARIGEFESGFEKGGQTQEHTTLVKTKGVKKLVVLINKMDDPSVGWNQKRFDEIKSKLVPFFKRTGFNVKSDIFFIPCSGMKGYFLKDKAPKDVCNWYDGPALLDYLDSMPPLERNVNGPLRLTVLDTLRDMGMYVLGKIESGILKKNQTVVVMPMEKPVEVVQISKDEDDLEMAIAGDNVKIKLKGCDEDFISPGFMLCESNNLCKVTNVFDAKVLLGDAESIFALGYSCMMHIHCLVKEVTIKKILAILDPKNPEKPKALKQKFMKPRDLAIVRFEVNDGVICVENFKDFQQMGRFVLRKNTQTVAQGMVMKTDIPASKPTNI